MTLGQGRDTLLGHEQLLSRSNMEGVMARTRILVCVHCDFDLLHMALGQVHDIPLGNGQQMCEILS